MTHADSDLFPWVRDVDEVWHRRPVGTHSYLTMCGRLVTAIAVCRAMPAAEGEWCRKCTP